MQHVRLEAAEVLVGHVGADERREVGQRRERIVELSCQHAVDAQVLAEEDRQRARESVVRQALAELAYKTQDMSLRPLLRTAEQIQGHTHLRDENERADVDDDGLVGLDGVHG